MTPTSEELARALARDLAPVTPIPPLRLALVGVAAMWALGAIVAGLFTGSVAGLWAGFSLDPLFLGVLTGLALGAGGATLAAVALGIPGREDTVARGAVVAAVGLVLALGTAGWLCASGSPRPALPFAAALSCTTHTCAIALLPALASLAYLLRGAVHRPAAAAGAALIGAVAAGGALVHAGCTAGSAPHVLLGHALMPLIVALVLALPLSALLRGRRSGSRAS